MSRHAIILDRVLNCRGCSIECSGACSVKYPQSSIPNYWESVLCCIESSIPSYSSAVCQFSGKQGETHANQKYTAPIRAPPRAAKTDEIPFMHAPRVVRNIHSPLHVVFRSGTRREKRELRAFCQSAHPSMAPCTTCTAAM